MFPVIYLHRCRPQKRLRSGNLTGQAPFSPTSFELIPAGRTGDGSIGRLRGFGGILLGDATPPCLHLYRSAPIAAGGLRRLAPPERDGPVGARPPALANAPHGLPRGGAARPARLTRPTLRD